jgi:hypothetical protein
MTANDGQPPKKRGRPRKPEAEKAQRVVSSEIKSAEIFEARQRAAQSRHEPQALPPVTWRRFREWIGPAKFYSIAEFVAAVHAVKPAKSIENSLEGGTGGDGASTPRASIDGASTPSEEQTEAPLDPWDSPVDPKVLQRRYGSEGGLEKFLAECFPGSTSKKPFGRYQLQSIRILESIIRGGGTQELIEPRGFCKSSRVARSALWAMLFGFRKIVVCFQSSKSKSVLVIEKIRNELLGNVALRAMYPELAACCEHGKKYLQMQKQQKFGGRPTGIQFKAEAIRLPDVSIGDQAEPYSGARLFSMPLAKAAGLSLSDPVTLEDCRPDLLLIDDPEAHDVALSGGGAETQKLVDVWNGSLKFLGSREGTLAAFLCCTILQEGDFASQLRDDPSIQTFLYGFFESMPTNLDWWTGPYRDTLFGFDERSTNGQAEAREAARALYRANKDQASIGAVVAWDHAFDPSSCEDAIEAGMRNYLTNEAAFWANDQNNPSGSKKIDTTDIRCRPQVISKKLHQEPKSVVPIFAKHAVAMIDVHDDLLYWALVAGGDSFQVGAVQYQTWPPQSGSYWSLSSAPNRFTNTKEFAELRTVDDRQAFAIHTLVEYLTATVWQNTDGEAFKLEAIGIDCGDNFDHIHSVVRASRCSALIPTRGISPGATGLPLNDRPKKPFERKRGDCWIEKRSDRTKQNWIEFDASYYKMRLHKGLSTPIGTTHSVSLFSGHVDGHRMIADHCNSEQPQFVRSETKSREAWQWIKSPGDNHFFDCLVGSMMLLQRCGLNFADVVSKPKRVRQRMSMADALESHGVRQW